MNIYNYLHLYLGCEVELERGNYKFPHTVVMDIDLLKEALNVEVDVKLVLRPLTSMTQKEAEAFGMMYEEGQFRTDVLEFDSCIGLGYYYLDTNSAAERIRGLLSAQFDIFGLIEAGLAIDKTKMISEQGAPVSDTTQAK
jgi:hypothetical protein